MIQDLVKTQMSVLTSVDIDLMGRLRVPTSNSENPDLQHYRTRPIPGVLLPNLQNDET